MIKDVFNLLLITGAIYGVLFNVNHYRVTYAKSFLKNSDFDHYTILSIGMESGFNSK